MRGLYKRGNIYWISYQAGTQTVRESTGTSDRKLAEGVLAKRRAEVFDGRWKVRGRELKTPLRQAAQEYLDLYARPHKISWREDERILRRFESHMGPDVPIHDIDRRAIEQFLLKLLAAGLSKARINRYTASLKCFFNRCADWGKLTANPCRGIRLYPETSRTHWLEAGQVTTLLNHCSKRLRPIVQIALLTGLRRGDILKLTWEQIDLKQRVIRIVLSKTSTPLVLPISDALADVLRAIQRSPRSVRVFEDRKGPLRTHGWLRNDFREAVRAAGLPGTRMHDLRHTAATHLRRLGCDLPVIQQLLGHRTIRTTLRYAHVHPTELRDAVNKLGQKIVMPTPRHFTITSQSPSALSNTAEADSQNESILRGETHGA